jgi:hypothetical protein
VEVRGKLADEEGEAEVNPRGAGDGTGAKSNVWNILKSEVYAGNR